MYTVATPSTLTPGPSLTLLPRITCGQVAPSELRVEVPFGFTAAGKDFPRETCLVKAVSGGRISLSIITGKTNAMQMIGTSRARSSVARDRLLAFDKLGGAGMFLWNTLSGFLATVAKTSLLLKFMRDRLDLSGTEGTSLSARAALVLRSSQESGTRSGIARLRM